MKVASYLLFAAFALASLVGAFLAGVSIGPDLQAQFSPQDVVAEGELAFEKRSVPALPPGPYLENATFERVYVSCPDLPDSGILRIRGELSSTCIGDSCFALIRGECF